MESSRRLVPPLILGLALTLAIVTLASWATPASTTQDINTGQHFLPSFGNERDRFGFDSGALGGYDVAQLNAGWYSDWGANLNPAHPDGLVYVQLVEFHAGANPNDPTQVTALPNKTAIAQIAAAHPGSLWLLANEPDSIYQGDPILPEVYAVVYHDYAEYIKAIDPNALIANGGIVQPTPCRLEYLDIVWDTYLATYGEPMPVDVWNIHAFILREVYGSWGASTPPGVDPSCGVDYAIEDADDPSIFWDNIRAMRTWMKEKGYQDRPLIISEYGVLWPEWFAPQFTPERVSLFMTRTFDLFLYSIDPQIGYPSDDDRLVQAWAWYSLSEDQVYNGYLFHSDTKTLSPMGEAYRDYTASLSDTLYVDLVSRLDAAWPSLTPTLMETGPTDLVTFTVSLTGSIGNLGKLTATSVLARFENVPEEGGSVYLGDAGRYTVPARFNGVLLVPPISVTLTAPGRHELRIVLDPDGEIAEPREWNNVATTVGDYRPDLAARGLAYRLAEPIVQSGTLALTATVANEGHWLSPPVSAAVSLEALPGGTLGARELFSVPPLDLGAVTDVGVNIPWLVPDHDFYRLVLEVDDGDRLAEPNENNNETDLVIPVTVWVTLYPTTTTQLKNASGSLHMVFRAGSVTTPTEMVYRPLWQPAGAEDGVVAANAAFSLTALLSSQPLPLSFGQPVTFSWHYSDILVSGLDETQLRLFVRDEAGVWRDAACQPYQRYPDQNWLTAALCRTGRFVFGTRHDVYVPLTFRQGAVNNAQKLWTLPLSHDSGLVHLAEWPPSPLRLPQR